MASNNNTPGGASSNAVSTTVILTTLQNIVTAINGWTQATLAIAGNQAFSGLTATASVATGAGRMVRLSVITAGSGAGVIYDATTLTDTSRPIAIIPMTAGVTEVSIPYSFGLVVAPGSGQKVSGSFS